MTNVMRTTALTAVLALFSGLILSAAHADVKVERVTHFGGIAGMGASDIHSLEYYQGDKKRDESSIKFTGAVMGALQRWASHGGNGSNSATIYRVNENKMFTLNTDKQTYREQPIYTPSQPSNESEGPVSQPSKPEPQQENDTRIVKNELTVKDTGQSKVVNGFSCHEYVITWDLQTQNIKTHELGKSLMTTDLWNSEDPRFGKLRADQKTYDDAYLRLIRVPAMTEDQVKQFGLDRFAYLGLQYRQEFAKKFGQIKGSPVVTDVKWEGGCENCQNSNQTQPQPAEQQSTDNPGSLSGMLSGLLAKQAQQKTQSDEQNQGGTPGMNLIFSSHTELKSIETAGLPAALFEVPAGYTRS